MRHLVDRWGLRAPILDLARGGTPMLGTCAGMILLAREIVDGDEPVFPLLDIAVKRNAFGRQLDSFEADIDIPILGRRAGPRGLHPRPDRRAGRARRGRPRPARRRSDRGRARAQRARDRVPPGARRRDALPPPPRDDGVRARRPRRGRRAPAPPHASRSSLDRDERPTGEGPGRPDHGPRRARRAVAPLAGRRDRSARLARAADQPGRRSGCSASSGSRSVRSPRTTSCSCTRRTGASAASCASSATPAATSGRSSSSTRSARSTRRHPLPPRPRPAARGRQARRRTPPRGVRGRRRQRPALHAGGVRPIRRGGHPLPAGGRAAVAPMSERESRAARIRPALAADAVALFRLHQSVTPAPVARLEMLRISDWERQRRLARRGRASPRSCGSPTSTCSSRRPRAAAKDGTQLDGLVQIGVAKEDQPHYLRVCARPERDATALVRFGLGAIAARVAKAGAHPREQAS